MAFALRPADGKINVFGGGGNNWAMSADGVWLRTSEIPGAEIATWLIMPDELGDVETLDEMTAQALLEGARAACTGT